MLPPQQDAASSAFSLCNLMWEFVSPLELQQLFFMLLTSFCKAMKDLVLSYLWNLLHPLELVLHGSTSIMFDLEAPKHSSPNQIWSHLLSQNQTLNTPNKEILKGLGTWLLAAACWTLDANSTNLCTAISSVKSILRLCLVALCMSCNKISNLCRHIYVNIHAMYTISKIYLAIVHCDNMLGLWLQKENYLANH